MVKVSVIIPVYKVKKDYFRECLESVMNQSLKEIEIILVDDCGGDGAIEFAKEVTKQDSRVKFVYNEINRGAGQSRNEGIRAATGEFVGFVDADDIIDQDFYRYLHYCAKYHDSDIVKGVMKNMSDEKLSFLGKRMQKPEYVEQDSLLWFTHEHITGLYRREMLVDHKITYGTTRVSEDITFLMKANYHAKKAVPCLDAVYYYRDFVEGSITASSYEKNIREYLKAIDERILFLEEHKDIPDDVLGSIMDNYMRMLKYWKKKYIDFRYGVNVSVVIPMYNCEEYVEGLFDCLLNQTMQNIEIICVDDGSTDGTAEKVKAYAERDKRISYYYQENAGAGAARNLGLKYVKGAYVIFLDADDFYEHNLIEKMFSAAEANDADVVNCLFIQKDYWKNETIEGLGYRVDLIPDKNAFKPTEVENLLRAFTQGPIDKLFRRQFISEKKITFSTTRIANDVKFTTVALIEASKIACIKDNLVTVRRYVNPNSISSNRGKYIEQAILAYREVYQELEERKLLNKYENQLCMVVGDTIYYNGQYSQKQEFITEITKWLKENPWRKYNKRMVISLLGLDRINAKKEYLNELKAEYEICDETVKQGLEIKIMFAENQITNIEKIIDYVEKNFTNKEKKTTNELTKHSVVRGPFLLRKTRGALQCWEDHGFIYTVKDFFRKVINKLTR